MERQKVLLWWFLYNVVGTLAGTCIGFIGGVFGGFFGTMFDLTGDSFATSVLIFIVTGALISNFFIFKWAVNKIIEN